MNDLWRSLKWLVDLDEILYGGDAIVGVFIITFNPIALGSPNYGLRATSGPPYTYSAREQDK
jgi:hypothetical protein